MSIVEFICLLYSHARIIRNNSLTLVKSSESRSTRRFYYFTICLCYRSSYISRFSGQLSSHGWV